MINFFKVYTLLFFVSFVLVLLRRDAKLVLDDMATAVCRDNFFLAVFNVFLIYTILPLTIPYSIKHIIRNINGK